MDKIKPEDLEMVIPLWIMEISGMMAHDLLEGENREKLQRYLEKDQSTRGRMASSVNLFKAWQKLNDDFIWADIEDSLMVGGKPGLPAGREFSTVAYNIQFNAFGWGLPAENEYLDPVRRVRLLTKRYINEPMWEEAFNRLNDKKKKQGGPMSFTFPFYRSADSAPTGGGCLISLSFTWWEKKWHIHVMSRASEITTRLLGDIYFVKHCVDRILKDLNYELKKWPEDNEVEISWNLLMASQMKHVVPFYILDTHGEEKLEEYILAEPRDFRQKGVQDYFWDQTLHPEKINWAQRRKWSDKFVERVDLDKWLELKEEYGPKE